MWHNLQWPFAPIEPTRSFTQVKCEDAAAEGETAVEEKKEPELTPEELKAKELAACTDGKMDMTYPSGGVYKGACKDGLRHGEGVYTYADGSVYNGAWVDDEKNGYGSYLMKA
jgi:hypothetical protein